MIAERDLRQLDDVLSRSPLAFVAWDKRRHFSYWSAVAQELFGYDAAEMLGKHAVETPLIHPDDRARVLQAEQNVDEEMAATLVAVSRNIRADGEALTCRWTIVAVQDDPVYRVVAFVEDITETVRAQDAIAQSEQRLAQSEARLRSLFEHNPDAVLALDLDGTMTDCNDAAVRVSGLPRDTIVGSKYTPFLPSAIRPRVEAAFARAASGNPSFVTFGLVNGQGREIDVEGTIIPQYAQGQVVGIYAIFQDTTQRRMAELRLRTLAYYDTLTGLPNRSYLAEKVRDAIEVAQSRLSRVALLFLDLDRFKDVNDALGHARGDRLLQLVSRRLSEAIGGEGTIARMGGDEFVILLPNCPTTEAASLVAERAIAAVSDPFEVEEYEHYISTSIGIAIYPEDGRDDQELIKNADIAMSRAKERGRNGYYFYDPALEAPIHMRLSQEKLLRRALELEEFVVFYQPQLDLRSNRIVSVEALVRWNHPKSGLILPSHFIPSAEISGLIVQLGDWVLTTAARQVQAWQERLGRLRLAVNLSARQFHYRDLRKRIIDSLEQTGFASEHLEIEITESVAMADAAQTAEIIRDLAANDVRVALDDFGTGYSSLAYLRSFDLDVLKIDGSFVAGIGRSPSDETIVNTVIGMAHNLDLEVIAEGVETREQLAFLTAQGCDAVQGFAIAPAMAALEFEHFIEAYRETAAAAG